MTITVSFIQPACNGRTPGIGINRIRAMEQIAASETTEATALDGEFIVINNGESGPITVAFGTTPDAAATAENGRVTTAGFPIPAGQNSDPLIAFSGAKVNAKAVV
jgi:hypothetical protein